MSLYFIHSTHSTYSIAQMWVLCGSCERDIFFHLHLLSFWTLASTGLQECPLVLWLNKGINTTSLWTVMTPKRRLLILKRHIPAPLTATSSNIVPFLRIASRSAFNWTELNFKDKAAQRGKNASSSKTFEWGRPPPVFFALTWRLHTALSSAEQRGSIDSLASHTIQSKRSQLNRC